MEYIRKDERITVDKQKKEEEAEIDDFTKKLVKITVHFQKFNK